MTLMQTLIDRVTGHQRLTLTENQRMLVLRNGIIHAILGPGKHRLPRRDVLTELHDLEALFFTSPYERALLLNQPGLAAEHLTEFRAGADEVLVLQRDGVPVHVLEPEVRVLVWTAAGPWTVEPHALTDTLAVPAGLAQRITRAGLRSVLIQVQVPERHVGMLMVDGVLVDQLTPGAHAFWNLGRSVTVKQVDLRQRTHEVTGQEILTKDRVTLRVNLSADFRVTDPVLAVGAVKDFDQALHRSLQLAFRKTLGALTLDRLLADKVGVDAEAADQVRHQMAAIGIEVGDIALKDVILPGEMRDILTAVVAAEKEAEANVIRRREETNATRSLLNTAKVMAENPVMLRLKELEALETIAGRVERLTVHNGTEGLMSDLVRLRD